MHEYTSGRWIAVVGESAVALLDPSLGVDDARRLWENDRDGSRLSRWIEVLAARGITALPPFALVEARDDGLFVLVRGDLAVRAGARTVTGRGYSTWYEEVVHGATDFEITAPEASDDDETLPVTTGIVLAARVASHAPAGETNAGLTVAEDEHGNEAGSGGSGAAAVAAGTADDDTTGGAPAEPAQSDVADAGGAAGATAAGLAGAGLAGAGAAVAADLASGDDDDAGADVDAEAQGVTAVEAQDEARSDAEAEAAAEGAGLVDADAIAGEPIESVPTDVDVPDDVPAEGGSPEGEPVADAGAADGGPEGEPVAEGSPEAGAPEAPVEASTETEPDAVEEGAATSGGQDAFQADEQGAPGAGAPDAPEAAEVEGEGFADPFHEGAALEQSEDVDAHTDEPGRPDDAELAEALAAEDDVALTAEPTAVDGYVGEGPEDTSTDGDADGLIDNVPTWSDEASATGAGAEPGAEGAGDDLGPTDAPDAEHTQIYDDAADEGLGRDVPAVEEQPVDAHAVDAGSGAALEGAAEQAPAAGGYELDHQDQGGAHADQDGYDQQGYDQQGYDQQGYDQHGYGEHQGDDQGAGDGVAGPDHDGATSMVAVGDYAEGLILVLPDGTSVLVDRPVLLGRAPDAARFSGDDAPRIVQVRSPERDVSATHVEVRPAGDTVVVTDMDSTNGTVIVLPDQPAFRLHPRTGVPVPPGAYVELGTDAGFHVDVAGQVPEQ
ncbi:hypothetical protein [Georgenia sp. Z1491]|uniref:FHA domain-containing protein n=1 Tax=Georgenia sp. Z1491 TaxID=3416707 RepID=UPI003CE7CA34